MYICGRDGIQIPIGGSGGVWMGNGWVIYIISREYVGGMVG